jgi:hypothetical protein
VSADVIGSSDMSVINVTVSALQNPTALLASEFVSRTNSDGTVVSGLLSLCANRIPESQCTSTAAATNACGCTAADFAPIVQQDPFFNPNLTSHTIASINAADPNSARFVAVLDTSGNNLELTIQSGETQSVALTDAHNTSTTYTNTVTSKDTTSISFNCPNKTCTTSTFGLADSTALSYTETESVGTSQGTAHTQSLVLATTNPNCFEPVNIYEDTVFHTFVFENGSNSANPCP